MVKIYKQPFAHDGDTIVIPDASQPDGKMSNADGWTVDYQLPRDEPNYKPVDRQEMNGVFKEVTEALGQVQVQGAASWSPDGTPYPVNAQVYHDGKHWLALRANSVEPVEGEDWSAVMPQKAVSDLFASSTLRENIKVTVGAGGDFPTINAAVLHLSRFTPDLGVTAEVELQSGFVMEEQLFVEGLDLGWITITGVDAETVINEPSLTKALYLNEKPAFGVINGTLPTIGQLFIFSSKGSANDGRSGVMAYSVGRANILPGCGVKNAGNFGVCAEGGSAINATGADASGAGSIGISATHSSTINADGADASYAEGYGIYASSGSTINANGADASDAGDYGIYASSGSAINATGADASGAGDYGIHTEGGSTINAGGATGTLSQAENTVTADGIIFAW